jgi:cardiolipin synthase
MRSHRKIIVVDGKYAYTGGQNISDRHLLEKLLTARQARDLHFRVAGKIVDDLEHAFLEDWNYCCNYEQEISFTPRNIDNPDSTIWSRLILDGPNENRDRLNDLLMGIFSSAKNRLWISTPYFLPGRDLVGALIGAKLRGIDIRIFLPKHTNIVLVRWAMQHSLQELVARGIKVYFQPTPFVHTKAILIDANYSLIGSTNLDPRSLKLNYELGLEVFDTKFNADLTGYFQKQQETSIAATKLALQERPPWVKVRDALCWLFTPYL